jgi:hypothetical protein
MQKITQIIGKKYINQITFYFVEELKGMQTQAQAKTVLMVCKDKRRERKPLLFK